MDGLFIKSLSRTFFLYVLSSRLICLVSQDVTALTFDGFCYYCAVMLLMEEVKLSALSHLISSVHFSTKTMEPRPFLLTLKHGLFEDCLYL